MLSDRIDEGVINEAKSIKVIANYAVGYENIDIKTATAKGVIVTNTPGVLTDSTAGYGMGTAFLHSEENC